MTIPVTSQKLARKPLEKSTNSLNKSLLKICCHRQLNQYYSKISIKTSEYVSGWSVIITSLVSTQVTYNTSISIQQVWKQSQNLPSTQWQV